MSLTLPFPTLPFLQLALLAAQFSDPKGVYLNKDQRFVLDLNDAKGDKTRVKLPHPEIIAASQIGHVLLIGENKWSRIEAGHTTV